jgi:hypothetical protein
VNATRQKDVLLISSTRSDGYGHGQCAQPRVPVAEWTRVTRLDNLSRQNRLCNVGQGDDIPGKNADR